jgi:hypothetical protein
MIDANEPKYFRRNLENLVAVAERHGVAVVLVSFAYDPDYEPEPRVARPEYQQALDEHNEVIRSVSAESSASFFDFATVFPVDRGLFTDGRHVNEEGARVTKLSATRSGRKRVVMKKRRVYKFHPRSF